MDIELVLITLQALFISLYGVTEIVHSHSLGKRSWITVATVYLSISLLSIFFGVVLKESIHLQLISVLIVGYFLQFFVSNYKVAKLVLLSLLIGLSSGLQFFPVANMLVWVAAPLFLGFSFVLAIKKKSWTANSKTYFLQAGTLLTVFFLLEPVFIGIQGNLKPVPTIPFTSIINQQNFLLLGLLLLLVLGGFFWKEKSRP